MPILNTRGKATVRLLWVSSWIFASPRNWYNTYWLGMRMSRIRVPIQFVYIYIYTNWMGTRIFHNWKSFRNLKNVNCKPNQGKFKKTFMIWVWILVQNDRGNSLTLRLRAKMKKIDLNYFLKLSLVYFLEICSKLNGLKDTATILVIKVESWQRDGDVHHFGVLPGKNAAKQKR